jgi:hypothetical protein
LPEITLPKKHILKDYHIPRVYYKYYFGDKKPVNRVRLLDGETYSEKLRDYPCNPIKLRKDTIAAYKISRKQGEEGISAAKSFIRGVYEARHKPFKVKTKIIESSSGQDIKRFVKNVSRLRLENEAKTKIGSKFMDKTGMTMSEAAQYNDSGVMYLLKLKSKKLHHFIGYKMPNM